MGKAGWRVAGWPEASRRHVRHASRRAEGLGLRLIFAIVSTFSTKMELDADEPRKFQGPSDRILGGWGGWGGAGGPAKFWRGKAKILFGEEI